MLPSLYSVSDDDRTWSVPRAAGYGAAIGALAAAFKMFGMARLAGAGGPIGGHVSEDGAGGAMQIALAALAFALLCAAAAALRNYLARHFVRGDGL